MTTYSPVRTAAKHALPYTLPIATGFLFLGIAYGVYMKSLGFHFLYPILTAMLIYAGSVEFIVAGLLVMPFAPLNALLIALMVSGRQIFYGISMLEKYRDVGRKKWFLIATLVDEAFSLNYLADIPKQIDRGWFMFWVSLFLYLYWVIGVSLGALFGSFMPIDLTGIEFAMTALFLVIFAEQWCKETSHESALLGIGVSLTALLVFGKSHFLLPTLLGIWILLTLRRKALTAKLQEIKE
ncbi:branched-chain amino acid transporter AzlC [Volucribacter amazonae]|uniref:Branched-chain amino acid transporter AzlC n=2 Tax=Volucribacter amazonae TaxID=256731 RepID=A0A9X4SR72_9PAST|nr:branched-chain amino acid transporter AzlC [Volucribacter amazonae]